jgi:hypothetical protein
MPCEAQNGSSDCVCGNMHVPNKPFVFDALASRIKDIMAGG